jgi:hypothetical protein
MSRTLTLPESPIGGCLGNNSTVNSANSGETAAWKQIADGLSALSAARQHAAGSDPTAAICGELAAALTKDSGRRDLLPPVDAATWRALCHDLLRLGSHRARAGDLRYGRAAWELALLAERAMLHASQRRCA